MMYNKESKVAYYSMKELIFLAILFIVSFGIAFYAGISADRGSLRGILIISFIIAMSICGGIETYKILKLSKTTSESIVGFYILFKIGFFAFIAGVLLFIPHYIYSIWANIRYRYSH